MIAPAADLARARQLSAALSARDAQRMIAAGIELEEKRREQRRSKERAGFGRRISDHIEREG